MLQSENMKYVLARFALKIVAGILPSRIAVYPACISDGVAVAPGEQMPFAPSDPNDSPTVYKEVRMTIGERNKIMFLPDEEQQDKLKTLKNRQVEEERKIEQAAYREKQNTLRTLRIAYPSEGDFKMALSDPSSWLNTYFSPEMSKLLEDSYKGDPGSSKSSSRSSLSPLQTEQTAPTLERPSNNSNHQEIMQQLWLSYKISVEEQDKIQERVKAKDVGHGPHVEPGAFVSPGGFTTRNPYGSGPATHWTCIHGHSHPIPWQFRSAIKQSFK